MTAIVKEKLPLGLYQLCESQSLALELNAKCCEVWHSVSSSAHGQLFTIRANNSGRHFRVNNLQNVQVIDLQMKGKMLQAPHMVISFPGSDLPVMRLKHKGGTSRSMLIVDERDQPVLKIRPPSGFLNMSRTFQILGADDVEVGHLKVDIREWEIDFPVDLQLSCKGAIIGACLLYDMIFRSNL